MTIETFTFTGQVLDNAGQPVKRATLYFTASAEARDQVDNKTYVAAPLITTDDAGFIIRAQAPGVPIGDPGVELIKGVQYTLRGKNQTPSERTFNAPVGDSLDLADIIPVPPETPPTYSELMASLLAELDALSARVEELEAGTTTPTLPRDPAGPGLLLLTDVQRDPVTGDYLLDGLTRDPADPGLILIGA